MANRGSTGSTKGGRFQNFIADYQLMDPQDMDELLFEPYRIALGEETVARLQVQFDNYEYYQGRQHRDENGVLVNATELEPPADIDYVPTRYATNYFKTIINRKARWQMGGKHNVVVPRKKIEEDEEGTKEPSDVGEGIPVEGAGAQPTETVEENPYEIEEGYEKLLHQLWRENKMRTKLLQAARDRLIADRVVAKIVFNPNTGKIKWVFRPDTEFIPIYSDDDFEELIACHFIRQKIVIVDGEEAEAIQKQTFTLEGEGESRYCYLEESVYLAEDLSLYEQIQPKMTMDLDFIPVVTFEVTDLLAEGDSDSEVADLREQNDILNQMNEDAIDSLKFEMFSMTAVLNAPEGTAAAMRIAPGAVLEARGNQDGQSPSITRIESGFRWKEAFKDQYMRVKGAMHEVSGLPQVVPQELNFGGLNGDALQVLFHDIISDTEEHWLVWEYGLQELHEKTVRYLQARLSEPNFAYDKDIVRQIENYDTEIKFALPLPDNRRELVELLGQEMMNQVESQAGAMERLGVEDVEAKKAEIMEDQMAMLAMNNPYGVPGLEEEPGEMGRPNPGPAAARAGVEIDDEGKMRDPETSEEVAECPVCGGSGEVLDPRQGRVIQCQNCRGDGIVQVRKR